MGLKIHFDQVEREAKEYSHTTSCAARDKLSPDQTKVNYAGHHKLHSKVEQVNLVCHHQTIEKGDDTERIQSNFNPAKFYNNI